MPTHPYAILDVFTDTPLEGNPLAVFTDAGGIDEAVLQSLARETNLSETVFLYPPDDPATADARVRIFTPATELPFAGHPVLGTAYLVGVRDGLETVRLATGAGTISIRLVRDTATRTIVSGEMTQPIPTWQAFERPEAVLDALLLPASNLPIEVYDNGPRFIFVALDSVAALSALKPDIGALGELDAIGVSCFALTGPCSARVRMFAPGSGVVEDPATGSAAGPLAVHLARHGRIPFGAPLTITQGVEIARPSTLIATAYGSGDAIERVTVAGSAVLVARGEYNLG